MRVLGAILLGLFCISSANILKPNGNVAKESISYIDVLTENIQKENWENDELPCYNQMVKTLENARNYTLWAIWMLDSTQFPTGYLYGSKYQLGNYDECLKPPWLESNPELKTAYCLADITLGKGEKNGDCNPFGSADVYVNTKTKHKRQLNTITWGICVPSVCTRQVSKLLNAYLQTSVVQGNDVTISVDECEIAGQENLFGTGFYVFWYILQLLLIISIASTIFKTNKEVIADSFVTKLAKSFCMNKNFYDLIKSSKEDIPCLHGMRAITAIILAFTHQIFFVNSGAVGNGLDVDKDIDKGSFLMHTDLFTDTFLFMSGLLLVRGLYPKEKLENPIVVLLKRYIRLIGPMALIIFYMKSVAIHMGDGPIWNRLTGYEQETCAKNWWLSLLMMNNYVNSREMCLITLWYVPGDFQLTILGIALVYVCRRNKLAGKLAVFITSILGVLLPAYVTYSNKLPATVIYDVEAMINIRQNEVFNSTYIRSHYRIGSYLVGLGVGYLMSVYKPSLYRNCISKKQSILVFITSFAVGLTIFSMGGIFYTRPYDPIEAALYAATNRIIWVCALSGFVFLCEYGDLPIVNRLLSWHVWVPLSRLSYGLYLTHPVLILYNVHSTRTPMRQHFFVMLLDSFGPIVVGYLLSWMIWLLIQAPIINLTNFRTKSRTKTLLNESDETKKKTF